MCRVPGTFSSIGDLASRAWTPTRDAHRQLACSLRLEWGPTGADAIGPGCHVAVVVDVDVLSFTTTLTVAADRGTLVPPYPWHDESAARIAADMGYADDVDTAAQLDQSHAVPVLEGDLFVPRR